MDYSSLDIHPKLVEALSPSSGVYGVLWPIVVAQSPWTFRMITLRKVNSYLRGLCNEYILSDTAIRVYMARYNRSEINLPEASALGLSEDSEWRGWIAHRFRHDIFAGPSFNEFCALGGVLPGKGKFWCLAGPLHLQPALTEIEKQDNSLLKWLWVSDTKDILFETITDPFGFEPYAGMYLFGRADKAMAMFNFLLQTDKGSSECGSLEMLGSEML